MNNILKISSKGKWVIIVAIFFVLLFLVYLVSDIQNKKNVEYLVETIVKRNIAHEILATGSLNASHTIEVGTQVSGIISEIFVDFNDVVIKGQVIALLDTMALSAFVMDAEANLLRAESQWVQQKLQMDRYTYLLENRVIAQSEYDLMKSNFLSAVSLKKSASAQLDRALNNLKLATITAPMSGVIVSRDVNVGQTVAANFSAPRLFVIANDLSRMQLEAKVDEADIGFIRKNQLVSFEVDAFPGRKFKGVVKQIRLQPVVKENVVSYNVMLDAPNPDLLLLPGMTANIVIRIEEHKHVLSVSLAALFFLPEGNLKSSHLDSVASIWIESPDMLNGISEVNGYRMKKMQVKKGLENGLFVEVLNDELKEGMKVFIGIKNAGENIEVHRDLIPDKDDEDEQNGFPD